MANTIICIGREFGSGGHEIAMRLGELLHLKVYDNEILEMACAYGEVRKKLLEQSDEKATNPYLYTTVHEGNHHVRWGTPTSEVLFRLQSHEIERLAAQESCIFVGRCADYVLRKKDVALLRVFITAPIEQRIQRKMELEQQSYRRTRNTVVRMDAQRKKYYEHYTGQVWGVGGQYDLLLDMSQMSIPQAVERIAEQYRKIQSA